jgi:DNA uptake protein ComE-like DNA-binding protein
MVKRWCARSAVLFTSVLVTACAAEEVPAETAVRAAERPVATVVAEASSINLNSATQRELESLRGIGPATAKRIIRNRPYASTAELSRAEVAGPIIELISSRVTVGPAPGQPMSK